MLRFLFAALIVIPFVSFATAGPLQFKPGEYRLDPKPQRLDPAPYRHIDPGRTVTV